MNMAAPGSPKFAVRRHEPELVKPAKPSPRELKQLSDIDDQEGLRFHIPFIMFYRGNPQLKGKDPVRVIKEALAKTLVYYYPFAGRLREGPNRKLMVDCTSEGVLFIEADADVTFDQLGDAIQPICPCLQEFLYDVPGSQGILDCPVLLIQVSRLKCGGFIFAIRLNHTISDSLGLLQFLITIGEMARGACAPSQPPVWNREILNARDPPRVTCVHHEYEDISDTNGTKTILDDNNMVPQSFFFGPKEMRSIRMHLPPHLRTNSTFEVLTACLWRCRTIALKLDPNEVVRVSYMINVRGNHTLQLPLGYYGNASAYPMVLTKAKELCENPLEYALAMVKKIKTLMTEEYIKSVADLMVIKGRPRYRSVNSFLVADTTRVQFGEIDFGWGKAVYGGLAGPIPLISFFARFKNNKEEDGIVVPIWLPSQVMKRFQEELVKMTREWEPVDNLRNIKPARIESML